MRENKYVLQADGLQLTRIFISILKQGTANYDLRAVVCWPAALFYPARLRCINLLNQYSISYNETANWRIELTLFVTLLKFVSLCKGYELFDLTVSNSLRALQPWQFRFLRYLLTLKLIQLYRHSI
jgi:hypothetical protein